VAIPDRVESAGILLGLDPPDWFFAHVTAVAEIASFLALRIRRANSAHDRRLGESAALLHDVDKLLPAEQVAGLEHGRAGARWLTARGYAELGPAVAGHPVRRLESESAASWLDSAPLEERVVCYADKRADQRLVSMEQRFAGWERRHPEHRDALRRARHLAERLERDVCRAARVAPSEVRRTTWVRPALARLGDAAR
jgi:hypothetical protein